MTPGSEADLAEAVASAKGPVAVRGGGTRPIGRPVAGEVLTVTGLSGSGPALPLSTVPSAS